MRDDVHMLMLQQVTWLGHRAEGAPCYSSMACDAFPRCRACFCMKCTAVSICYSLPEHLMYCMYVCMYDYIAVSTRTLTPPTTGTDWTLKGTCWCKPRSQPSCATKRAISPKGNGRATKPATSAAGPPLCPSTCCSQFSANRGIGSTEC